MNYADWYTDQMDIWRVQAVQDGSLTRHERAQVAGNIPCRIYRNASDRAIDMRQEAALVWQESKLACDNGVDIREGDELRIRRGALVGGTAPEIRAFAGEPHHYYEPFGAVIPGLAHQEIRLLQEERVK